MKLHTIKTAALAVSLLFSTVAHSQGITIGNQKTYGGNAMDYLGDMIKINDGTYIVGGESLSLISGDKTEPRIGLTDYWVLNLDSALNINWQKVYGGDSADAVVSIIQTIDGNIICAGSSNSIASGNKTAPKKGNYDYWLVKTDPLGNIIWDKTYGGAGVDYLQTIIELNDGSLLLAGYSNSGISGDKTQASKGDYDYWLVKTDAGGAILWDKTIGGTAYDALSNAALNANEEIILSGRSASGISGDKTEANFDAFGDVWLVKLNTAGNIIWDKTIGGTDTEVDGYVGIDNNFIYVASPSYSNASGTKTENSKGDSDYWLTKLNNNGNILWDKTIGADSYDSPRSLTFTSGGNILLSGESSSGISGDKTDSLRGFIDFWLVCIDTSGVIIWQKTIGGSGLDALIKTFEISPSDYMLAGVSQSNISGDKSENNRGGYDYWLVEISLPVGINETLNDEISVSIYPNPAIETINIKGNIELPAYIVLYDLTGRKVLSQSINSNQPINISALAKGLYVWQLGAARGKLVIE